MTATAPAAPFVASPNIAQLKESATIAVSARARALRAAGRTIIDLGAGEPDFATPPFIRQAAAQAVEGGATRYTATEGILPLREAIAAEANALYQGADPITANDVVVSNGSKQSLFNACFVLFGNGDEVLIPTPSWTSYYEMVTLSRAVPVPVYGERSRGLKVTAAQLADAATPRTRGVMLNSPCNPTGAVYSEQELRDIASLAADRGWWLISDEIYRRIAYDAPARSVLEVIGDRERVVYVNGVAKAYAMTGWRIGWAVAPRAVAQAMGALQSHTTSNPATVSQYAALAALTRVAEAEQAIAGMVAQFRARRDAASAILDAAGVRYVPPGGAFYLYIDVGGDGSAFATKLLDQHGVAVVPGSAFYTPEWVRASYAAPMETVVEGIRRLVQVATGA
jgi:aspartate aminotransferase